MLFKDLGVYLYHPPILWCDNVSALSLASNPIFHARTKHIEVDYHFVREKVLNRDMVIKYISTSDQLADLFTKSLPSPRFHALSFKLVGLSPLHLRGVVKDGVASVKSVRKASVNRHAQSCINVA